MYVQKASGPLPNVTVIMIHYVENMSTYFAEERRCLEAAGSSATPPRGQKHTPAVEMTSPHPRCYKAAVGPATIHDFIIPPPLNRKYFLYYLK